MTKDKTPKKSDVNGDEESALQTSTDNFQRTLMSYEERLNFVNEIAQPMANRKLTKRIYKLLKKAAHNREYCRSGLKSVQTSIRKGSTGLLIMAGDVTPLDVMIHLPAVCEDKGIPYCYVPSKEDIGTALGHIRNVVAVLIINNPEIEDVYNDIIAEVQALPKHFL